MGSEITPYRPPGTVSLPDTEKSDKRFEIKSGSSNRIYVIGRDKKQNKWFCTCPGWKRWRHCKHLTDGCGLPMSMILGADRIEGGASTRQDNAPTTPPRRLTDGTSPKRRRFR